MSSHTDHNKINTDVRIIIPSYKASETINICLLNVLQACDKITHVKIIVVAFDTVINIPTDPRVHIIQLAKALNAGEARNLGAAHSSDCILVFIDADVLIEPDSLSTLITPIMEGDTDAAVGNYSVEVLEKKFFQNYKKLYINQTYAKQGYITNEFWTAYSAISSKAFAAVGKFSPEFQCKGGEDTEIGIRLTANKYRIYAVAGVFGKHLKEFTFGSLVNNDFVKGSRTVFLSLNKKMSLKDNRHAKKSDQLAVASACFLALLLVSGMFMHWIWLFVPLCSGIYITSRFTFFHNCVQHGFGFVSRAILLAWFLDIVRALSISNGIRMYAKTILFGARRERTKVIEFESEGEVVYYGEGARG